MPTTSTWLRWSMALVWLTGGVAIMLGATDRIDTGLAVLALGVGLWLAWARGGSPLASLQAIALGLLAIAGLVGTASVVLVASIVALAVLEQRGWSSTTEMTARGMLTLSWLVECLLLLSTPERLASRDPAPWLVLVLAELACVLALASLRSRTHLGSALLGQLGLLIALPWVLVPTARTLAFGPPIVHLPLAMLSMGLFTRITPVVHARWADLAIATFAIDPERARPRLPADVELDLWEGQAVLVVMAGQLRHPSVYSFRSPSSPLTLSVLLCARKAGTPGYVVVEQRVTSTLAAWVTRSLVGPRVQAVDAETHTREQHGAFELSYAFAEHQLRIASSSVAHVPEPDSFEAFVLERKRGFAERATFRVEHARFTVRRSTSSTIAIDWAALLGDDLNPRPLHVMSCPGGLTTIDRSL